MGPYARGAPSNCPVYPCAKTALPTHTEIVVCSNLNLHITIMLHNKYRSIAVAGSSEVFFPINFIYFPLMSPY